MTWLLAALVALATTGLQHAPPELAADQLTRVRELYALASYEDALAHLDTIESRIAPEAAAQYRALCLIGLGRIVDAEAAISRFVLAHPTYSISETDVSPRLVTLFRETRLRVLPAEARTRYTSAKQAFDRQQFTAAARGFREVLTLLGDTGFIGQVEGLRDLRLLAESFLQLAEAEIEKAEAAMAPPPPAPGPTAEGSVAAAETGPIYSADDPSVVAPVEVNRRMPIWDPPTVLEHMQFRGVLEVVIDEQGAVSEATLVRSIHPYYDRSLIDATTRWRFRPATKEGVPVRFRQRFEVVLSK
jgi:TonB family protein